MNLFTSRLAFSISIIFLVDVNFVNYFNQSKWHRIKKHKSIKKLVVYHYMTQLENKYQNANNHYHDHVTKEV